MRSGNSQGFTLIELMIVVVIVATLSFAAIGAYRRYLDNARTSEVASVFAEIRAKEEAYRSEFSTYLTVSANEDDFWPVLLAANEPSAKNWQPAPAAWNQLGVNPGKAQVYCGFSIVAGDPGTAPGGVRGAAIFPVAPDVPWWHATGTCDNDGDPAVNVLYGTSSASTTIVEQNPHH